MPPFPPLPVPAPRGHDLHRPECVVATRAGDVFVADWRGGRRIFSDGFAFDEMGALWVTSLVSNRLLRVDHDGSVETLIEDVNARGSSS